MTQTNQSQVFVSAINGAKFDVQNPLTAALLSKNEKKEIVHRDTTPTTKQGKGTKGKKPDTDNEQEIT